jgi:hypothetical protein
MDDEDQDRSDLILSVKPFYGGQLPLKKRHQNLHNLNREGRI